MKFHPFLPLLALSLLLPATSTAAPALPLSQVREMASHLDQLIAKDLKAEDLKPLPLVSDEIFVRRIYLKVVGRIPTAQEAMSFLDDRSADKRSKLIETLAASRGYDSQTFNYYADLLRLQTGSEQYGLGWHVWLRNSIAENKPWDDLVNEMLGAEGHSAKNPAVGYYLRDRGMLLDNVSNTMQVFLGHQIGCAQCHDHPFDTWTQMEYYEIAAFSGGVNYRSTEARKAVQKVVADMRGNRPATSREPVGKGKKARRKNQKRNSGMVRKVAGDLRTVFRDFNKNEISEVHAKQLKLPEDYAYEDGDPGEVIPPATLFGRKIKDVDPEERRQVFADWVTGTDNPYFTKVMANRLWDRAFGHGLVDPVDNWSKDSETAHPEVLAYLVQVMHHVDFRTRDFDRVLFHTQLFQRESNPVAATPGTVLHFRGPELRRMKAEELHDSLLVLAYGNVDDNINESLEKRWNMHQESVLEVINATPRELLALDEIADAAEQARIDYQRRTRQAQTDLREAVQKKDHKTAAKIRRRLNEMRTAYRAQQQKYIQKRYPGRNSKARRNMRASEYPTPFKGNHFVRQFGGSDRLTPEAGDTFASTPQALTLLNGQIARSTDNRKSKVFEAIAEITSPETRLEYLFLAFYGTRPTAAEQQELLPLASHKDAIFTLARAMLTSKRYLFVQ